MTDNEIIKALDSCILGCCECCAFNDDINLNCKDNLMTDALDLINRQKAGIERLEELNKEMFVTISEQQAEIERLESEYPCKVKCGNNCEIWAKSLSDYDNLIGDISAEGIKEFAERLKEKTFFVTSHLGNISVLAMHKLINNLVKEMTEGGVDNA